MVKVARVLFLSAASAIALTSTVIASERPLGCYVRTYDAAHLRDKRSQQVRSLWFHVGVSRYDFRQMEFGLNVWVRGKPQIWRAGGLCEPDANGWRCRPDTDGASELLITLKGASMHLSNPGRLKISDDATGPDLNDMLLGPPGDSLFVLQRTRDIVCKRART